MATGTITVASWNVNSLRVRLPQCLPWLASARPDIVCLQETKVVDELFPLAEIEAAGYAAVFSGQKTYNGVAILWRKELSAPVDVRPGIEGDLPDAHKRALAARFGSLTVQNVYVPNGSVVDSDKYVYKLDWLARLETTLRTRHTAGDPLLVCGDFNVAPADRDVYDADEVRGTIMFSDREHAALEAIRTLGLADTLREHTDAAGLYSWWDYRAGAFPRNRGWRIDLILASEPAARACTAASIDVAPRRLEKPSDHAPVLAVFDASLIAG
jgi:exodeoxyribonuclease-3